MSYSKIHRGIWRDERFLKLSNDTRLMFIYLITNNHCNNIGAYFLPINYIEFDLGWTKKKGLETLQELIDRGFVMYDNTNFIVYIINFVKYNPLYGPNQMKSAISNFNELPNIPILQGLASYLDTIRKVSSNLLRGVPIPFEYRFDTYNETHSNPPITDNRYPITDTSPQTPQGACAEPDEKSGVHTETEIPEKPILQFPVVGKKVNEKFWCLYQNFVDQYSELYPKLDILAECKAAYAWIISNESRRKTARGMKKFLNGWFERSNNRKNEPRGSPPPETKRQCDNIPDPFLDAGKPSDEELRKEYELQMAHFQNCIDHPDPNHDVTQWTFESVKKFPCYTHTISQFPNFIEDISRLGLYETYKSFLEKAEKAIVDCGNKS